jgi:hypothetical protein
MRRHAPKAMIWRQRSAQLGCAIMADLLAQPFSAR